MAILGMGKLGSRELTAGSDVDLILLYDHDEDAEESDGDKPLAPSHYYARLTQRLIAAVSAPTAEGVLYEVDLRLRPSGNKGPVATHIDAFRKYQRREAWTWEHMALTRARAVAGDAALRAEVEAEVAAILALPRDGAKVADGSARDAHADREGEAAARRVGPQARPGRADRSRIHRPGGNLGQQCARRGTRHRDRRNPVPAFAEFADEGTRRELADAFALYTALTQMIRLCLTGPFDREEAPPGLADLILSATDLPDLAVLEAHLKETAQTVRSAFDRLLRAKG